MHIGFHKTGTSALQEHLDENREALMENEIYYPKPLCRFPAQQELAWSLFDTPPPWADKTYEKDIVYRHHIEDIKKKGKKKTILSGEEMSTIGKDLIKVEFIREMFIDFDCKIVAYVREPLEFLISLYHHKVRVGETDLDFKEHFLRKMNPKVAFFAQRLGNWRKVFGKENVIVRKYSKNAFVSGSLINDFMSVVECDAVIQNKEKRVNVGIHPWINVAYRMTTRNFSDDASAMNNIHRQLLQIGNSFPSIDARSFYLSKDDLRVIEMIFREQNSLLEKTYGIRF